MCQLIIHNIYTHKRHIFKAKCSKQRLERCLQSVLKNSPKRQVTKRHRQLSCILDKKFQKLIFDQIFISIYKHSWYKITIEETV